VAKELPEWRFFKPRCVDHMKRVLRRIDLSYTDEQLRTVLEHECVLDNDFPQTREDGFEHNRACKAYADDLTAARDEELATGKTDGYAEFCKNYYVHKGGKLEGVTGESKVYNVRKDVMKELKNEAEDAEKEGDKVEAEVEEEIEEVETDSKAKSVSRTSTWIPVLMILILVVGIVALLLLRNKYRSAPAQQ